MLQGLARNVGIGPRTNSSTRNTLGFLTRMVSLLGEVREHSYVSAAETYHLILRISTNALLLELV